MRWLRLGCLLVGAIPWAGVAAWAGCLPAQAGACVIELHGEGAPRATETCSGEAWAAHLGFDLPERFADADGNGWHETVLGLELDPGQGCGCAVFRITFEGTPAGYTVHVGDSPTNDGHGGDAWSTRFDAELMLSGRDLTAYGSEQPQSFSDAQIFGLRELPIADRTLELEICDQSVRFAIGSDPDGAGFHGFFNTYRSRDLIAIRPAPADETSPATQPDARIYASFNRVIHRRNGLPAKRRFGAGVRRVEISLTP